MSDHQIGSPPPAIEIHCIGSQLLIFDVALVKHLREHLQICGVLSGTLFQIPQQSVFLGLPLQLMIEEAAWLVRHHAAILIDDANAHWETFAQRKDKDARQYMTERAALELALAQVTRERAWEARRTMLKSRSLVQVLEREQAKQADPLDLTQLPCQVESASAPIHLDAAVAIESTLSVTSPSLPQLKESQYDMYTHLHKHGYFMTPGLRFGGQFVAYPGDPLRYHSHFLATGLEYDEPFPVMDLVVCGRLGTAVKKAWLIGATRSETDNVQKDEGQAYKCFTIQWAGF